MRKHDTLRCRARFRSPALRQVIAGLLACSAFVFAPGASALAQASFPQGEEAATRRAQNDQLRLQIPEAVNRGKEWRIVKDRWDPSDEDGYSAFVQAIGWSDCTSLEECLANPANPYRDTDTQQFSGDCADMAYILRAYYAWKNGLPFSYQSAMRTADGRGEDTRYSSNGNVVAGRRSVAQSRPVSAPGFIGRMPGEVSTAMFRTHPEKGGGQSHDDFYPVAINRGSVRPGVIAYDIYGHVGIVYDILDDGRVLVVASHPDHSVTRTTYGRNFLRSKPELGAGLKAWRPIRLDGARRADDGSLTGGRIRAALNSELPDFSVEQYFGNQPDPSGDWMNGEFRVQNRTVDYYDYVRRRLASPDFAYNPVTELRFGMETLCGSLRDRKAAVDRATTLKVHLRPHPKRLPPNIFGTYGEWEEFSTPSRDARLKVAFIDLKRSIKELVDAYNNGDEGVTYDGDDLPTDLWEAFLDENEQCRFTYWRSDDTRVRMTVSHVMDRLWDLSFDPYHCPERRWGADGAELATCTDDEEKTRWYNAQRFLRYQAERTYDVRMDFTLAELKPPSVAAPEDGGIGVEAPADADIRSYLAALKGMAPSSNGGLVGDGTGILLTAAEAASFEEPRFPEWHYKILNHWGAGKNFVASQPKSADE